MRLRVYTQIEGYKTIVAVSEGETLMQYSLKYNLNSQRRLKCLIVRLIL